MNDRFSGTFGEISGLGFANCSGVWTAQSLDSPNQKTYQAWVSDSEFLEFQEYIIVLGVYLLAWPWPRLKA